MSDQPARPDCPICAKPAGDTFFTLAFRAGGSLPDRITLHACDACDLVFSWPREAEAYDRHYAQVANDFLHADGRFENLEQLERLSRFIRERGLTRVLDFGCGGGGLAAALAARHPDVEFVGFDINAGFPSPSVNLSFSQSLPDGRFDLVILSHVLEHAADPVGMIELLRTRYAPQALYIETPSPQDYLRFGQPQYLYYIDRLHINHFGFKALLKAAGEAYDLVEYGRYGMPYDLGPFYPCQYSLFLSSEVDAGNVKSTMTAYAADEAEKARAARAAFQGRPFYVYGFGDNFFRARSGEGPLAGLDSAVLGVIDRSIDRYRAQLPEGWQAIHPDQMAELNGALIVCTVTQSSGLGVLFEAQCPDSEVIYL